MPDRQYWRAPGDKAAAEQCNVATLTDLSLLVLILSPPDNMQDPSDFIHPDTVQTPQTPPHRQFWKALRDKTAADNMTPIELSSIVLTLPTTP